MAHGRIGFIGAGKMATAIIRGWISAGTVVASDLCITAPSDRNTRPLKEEFPDITVAKTNVDVVQRSTIVFLAVKPHILPIVAAQIKSRVTPAHLLVTIAAGATTAQVEAMLGPATRVVRVMPNTPCAIRCNAGAVSGGSNASPADIETVCNLFAPLSADGTAPDSVPDSLMDAVTGVAGSGPAFVLTFIEAMADGGVYAGLPRHIAAKLAAQTVMGAAKLVLETGEHPAALRDAVCSPGGTTITGVRALETHGLRNAVISAVAAAAEKGGHLRAQADEQLKRTLAAEEAAAAASAAASADA
ncbi:hypothetical protein FNF27_05143 [Cafeteria roenbergensis]|uniref:Pyrroline-5-carboxylate reductase n=1 Tax=Cafeteria roenbergensis TaxID=33653 RepID=A0A5A8E6P4_CAFRO|nr:hypothetical protein FNF29_06035 [Cafeteria roenbergensis]KAA0157921.1 hypothetical protein FNF31_05649 [Cafeteria roenbergensis]KAA0161180.1 hypothetical protein FNF28_05175 [Cafeteria roenbergensis]KAA0173366.1 hypothetical protein FNF27_05143 [Cafeteria roenbergensis]CAE6917622.1 proC [Symbiodinium sp. KB8]|eukprot:KAA0149330.1 hypothetical protein FNF29_06035 [Cafeteria roenbergensis]